MKLTEATCIRVRGFSVVDILTYIFVISKILGVIDWSWWTVFSPQIVSVIVLTLVSIPEVWENTNKKVKK